MTHATREGALIKCHVRRPPFHEGEPDLRAGRGWCSGSEKGLDAVPSRGGYRICRVSYEYVGAPGGSIVHVTELARAVSVYAQQWLVTQAFEDEAREEDDLPFKLETLRCPLLGAISRLRRRFPFLHVGPLFLLGFVVGAVVRVGVLHRRHRFDVLHGHGVYGGVACTIAGRILRVPVVWMAHGTCDAYSRRAGLEESILTKMFCPDHIVVLDDGSDAPRKFAGLVGPGSVTVVRHAIDTAVFNRMSRDVNLACTLHVQDAFVAMCVQSLIPVKGTEFAIAAFAAFAESYPGCARLVILGDGPERERLERLAAHSRHGGDVVFVGSIPNVEIRRYLSMADIVLETSLYSNVNRSAQEAMACGKALAVFGSGRYRALFRHGENAYVVAPGDVDALSTAIRLLAEDQALRVRLGDAARRTIADERTWEQRKVVEMGVYERVFALRNRR